MPCSAAPTGCSRTRVGTIATSFPGVLDHDARFSAKAVHTGNPVRPMVVEAAATPYPDTAAAFRILAFGGSQGARIMADIVPPAVELVPMAVRARLHVTQQARDEDLERVRAAYAPHGRDRRGRAVLLRPAAPNGGEPSRGVAFGRLDGRRTRRDRPAGDPGAAAPCARPGPEGQCRPAAAAPAARSCSTSRASPRTASPARSPRLAAEPGKLAAMAAAARGQGILDAADRLADLVVKVAGIKASPPLERPHCDGAACAASAAGRPRLTTGRGQGFRVDRVREGLMTGATA